MLLELKDITKSFSGVDGDVEVLRGVSLQLEAGQTLALTGESGSGKSTILHISAGLEVPNGGSLHLEGIEINGLGEAERANLRRSEIGIVFQQFNLIPSLTVEANIGFQAALAGRRDKIFESELVEALGLADQLKKYPESLSGGQQQRVAICRAMMQDPKLILADEPIASLDPLNARLVMESLRKIHDEQNITVICNLHTLDTAKQYCDRIIGMQNGEIVFDDLPSKLTNQKAREIYGAEADEAFEGTMTSVSLESADIKKTA